MLGAIPREMGDYVKSDVKRMSLMQIVENEVFPHMKNQEVRDRIRDIINDPVYDLEPKEFKDQIDQRHTDLITIRAEEHEENSDKMLASFKNRFKSRPYIFKLVRRVAEDYARVLHLKCYEQEQKYKNPEFNLKDLLPEE